MEFDGLRVFVVEDEAIVSMLIEETLQELGCIIVGPAGSVDEALAVLAEAEPDCAILDVNIRGSYVYPVADALRTRNIPYAFSTGYGNASLRSEDADTPVLHKPFRPADLEQVVAMIAPGLAGSAK